MGSVLHELLTEVPLSTDRNERVTNELGKDTARVLVHLFMTESKEERTLGTMPKKLGMERNVLQYHLEQLEEAGLADLESGKLLYGRACWQPTPKGRKWVVEGDLV